MVKATEIVEAIEAAIAADEQLAALETEVVAANTIINDCVFVVIKGLIDPDFPRFYGIICGAAEGKGAICDISHERTEMGYLIKCRIKGGMDFTADAE